MAEAREAMEELERLFPETPLDELREAPAELDASTAALHSRTLQAGAAWDETRAVLTNLQDEAASGAALAEALRAELGQLDDELNALVTQKPQPAGRIARLHEKRAASHASLRAQLAMLEENRHAQVETEQALRVSELELSTANDRERHNFERREREIAARKARHEEVRRGELQRARTYKAQRQRVKQERDALLAAAAEKEEEQVAAAHAAHDAALARLREHQREISRQFTDVQSAAEEVRERRLAAVASLKDNVDNARGQMAASLARHTRERTQKRQEQQQEAKAILERGGNPYEVFRKRELDARAARDRKERHSQQQARELAIVEQALREEERRQQKLAKTAELAEFNETFQDEMGTRAVEARNEAFMLRHTTGSRTLLDPTGRKPVPPSEATKGLTKGWAFGLGLGASKEVLDMVRTRHPKVKPEPLLLPSYPGMEEEDAAEDAASREPGVGEVASEDISGTEQRRIELRQLTVLEQKQMERGRARHKETLTRKQVCLGRTFEGPAFIAAPTKVVFKDFDVGGTYTQSVVLTNISFTFNQFKVLDFPDDAEGAFTVSYVRPGRMSAGTTCELVIGFEPHEDKDIETTIPLLSETGPIAIPLAAYKKRFAPSLSTLRQGDLRKVPLRGPGTVDEPAKVDIGDVEIAASVNVAVIVENGGAIIANMTAALVPEGDGAAAGGHSPFVVTTAEGVVAGYATSQAGVTFAPTKEGKFSCTLVLRFEDLAENMLEERCIEVTGRGGKVPVVAERPVVDLECCCLGHVYRDQLVLENRGKTARKCSVHKLPELEGVLEFYPDYAFCQSGDKLTFQIKFTPTERTRRQCAKFIDDNGVLEVPMRVTTDQAAPVEFTVRSLLTKADLVFDPPSLSFGECPTTERISMPLTVKNASALPQDFGFVKLPRGMLVSPEDGFGTILPGESIQFEVSFAADFPMTFTNPITIKTSLNHTYTVPFTAHGFLPDVTMSDNVMYLPATAMHDRNSGSVIVRNNSNAPRDFEIGVPKDIGIKVAPTVGTVPAGGSLRVQVDYAPHLHEAAAAELASTKPAPEEPVEEGEEGAGDGADAEEAGKAGEAAGNEEAEAGDAKGAAVDGVPSLDLQEGGLEAEEVVPQVWCYPQRTVLPCFVRDSAASGDAPLSVIGLEVCTCAIDEELLVEGGAGVTLIAESGKGYNELNFGSVPIRERKIMSFVVVNASRTGETVQLSQESTLDPGGAFTVMNPYQSVPPGESHRVLVEFNPTKVYKFFEMLIVRTSRARVRVALTGDGISPSVGVEPPEVLDTGLSFGSVKIGERAEKTFQVRNNSSFELSYDVRLGGIARRNAGGIPPFYCIPASGIIAPEEVQEVKVVFAPDACAPLLEGTVSIEVANQEKGLVVRVQGRAWEKGAYICGVDPGNEVRTDEEEDPLETHVDASVSEREETLTVTLGSHVSPGESVEKEVFIGSLKSEAGGAPVEFTTSELFEADTLNGWRIEGGSGSVAPGEEHAIKFAFEPPREPAVGSMAYFGLGGWSECRVTTVLKGGMPAVGERRVVLLARCYVQPTDPDATAAAPREEKSDETAQG